MPNLSWLPCPRCEAIGLLRPTGALAEHRNDAGGLCGHPQPTPQPDTREARAELKRDSQPKRRGWCEFMGHAVSDLSMAHAGLLDSKGRPRYCQSCWTDRKTVGG